MEPFNCKSRRDMMLLAHRLRDTDGAAVPAVAAFIMAHGLMLPPWWLRLGAWLFSKRTGLPRLVFWANMVTRFPPLAADMIEQTAEWIVNGKDVGGEGIGGFDQREVDLLVHALDVAAPR